LPRFDDSVESDAPIEEVWKLLYDPTRFTEWWVGIERVEPGDDGFTVFPAGYPDFPMPQQLNTDGDGHKVLVSCLVSDLQFEWRLEPLGERTRIAVHVEIPEAEAARLESQRGVVGASLRSLAALASAG
jgi:uncharacterized protein YndB with AHSA1/START domain